jgi:hypothetical protein
MKYRKKPIVIDAVQFDGGNITPIFEFVDRRRLRVDIDGADVIVTIETLEGDMRVSRNDYIIKGVNGEFYPCKPDIFAKTYEAVSE